MNSCYNIIFANSYILDMSNILAVTLPQCLVATTTLGHTVVLLCTACHPECISTGARMCFGTGNEKCCNFYDEEDKCLPACNKVGANFTCTGIFYVGYV